VSNTAKTATTAAKVVRNFVSRNPLLGKCHYHDVSNKQIRNKAKSKLRHQVCDYQSNGTELNAEECRYMDDNETLDFFSRVNADGWKNKTKH
jgi:hypothetical protein